LVLKIRACLRSHRLGVRGVEVPVPNVLRSEGGAVDEQQVLGVAFLCRSGEVEAAGDDGVAIYDNDVAVGYRVLRIDQQEHSRLLQEGWVPGTSSQDALVKDNSYITDASLGLRQCLCDGCGG
jgi:hypothetical protein